MVTQSKALLKAQDTVRDNCSDALIDGLAELKKQFAIAGIDDSSAKFVNAAFTSLRALKKSTVFESDEKRKSRADAEAALAQSEADRLEGAKLLAEKRAKEKNKA